MRAAVYRGQGDLRVEEVPMLVVEQGQVAVMKAYVGLPTQDTSGVDFKFGSLVRPGHRGIWQDPLRTGKYPINPRCYQAVIVPWRRQLSPCARSGRSSATSTPTAFRVRSSS